MSIGGFSSLLRVTSKEVGAGANDRSGLYLAAHMKLEGQLFGHNWKPTLEDKTRAEALVFVEIDFSEQQEFVDDNWKYIGKLHAHTSDLGSDLEPKRYVVNAHLHLPFSAFQMIAALPKGKIRFETVHDLTEGSEEQKALIKRAHFTADE